MPAAAADDDDAYTCVAVARRFLLALPDLVHNVLRSEVRESCRAWTDAPAEYDAITAATLSPEAMERECGWSGEPIRANLTAAIWYLRW